VSLSIRGVWGVGCASSFRFVMNHTSEVPTCFRVAKYVPSTGNRTRVGFFECLFFDSLSASVVFPREKSGGKQDADATRRRAHATTLHARARRKRTHAKKERYVAHSRVIGARIRRLEPPSMETFVPSRTIRSRGKIYKRHHRALHARRAEHVRAEATIAFYEF
jgi:hypothetical protein